MCSRTQGEMKIYEPESLILHLISIGYVLFLAEEMLTVWIYNNAF